MSWTKNFLLVITAIVLSLFTLEFGLRLIYPEKADFQNVRDHSDPFLPKHVAGTHVNVIRNSVATFDEDGMRLNPNQCASEDAIDVLVVGDSNIAGLFLSDSETLGAQITAKSLESDQCIKVDTFGVSGFGPDQSLFAIAELTKDITYDYVVFHIFADNDLGDLIRNNNFVDDVLINSGYCFLERPILERFVTFKAIRRAMYMADLSINLYGSTLASNSFDNACISIVHPNENNFAVGSSTRAQLDWEANRQNQKQIYMGDRYDIEFACNSNAEATQYVTQYFNRIVMDANELTRAREFKLVYLVQPSENNVTNNHKGKLDKGCDQYSPQNLSQFFVNALGNLDYINLYDAFLNCKSCYFTEEELGEDNHWSPYGVDIAAAELVQFITEFEKK